MVTGWIIFNVAFVLPIGIQLLYSVDSVLPALAAVENHDAAAGKRFDVKADHPSLNHAKNYEKPRAVRYSIRSMLQLLSFGGRSYFNLLGFIYYLLWNAGKGMALLVAFSIPFPVGLLFQTLLQPLLLQLHILWVHTILCSQNARPFGPRVVPVKLAFKAVAWPMFILFTAEAITQRILMGFYARMELKLEDFFPWPTSRTTVTHLFWLLLVILNCGLIIPAHVLLVRVEASLLPVDKHTIIPMDPVLAAAQRGRGYLTLVEARKSLTNASIRNLMTIYLRIIMVTFVTVGIVGHIDFAWFFSNALERWQF